MTSTATRLVDATLEASVVGSFSRIGYAVRSRLFGWADLDRYDLRGRSVLVTGATSGLGRAAAERYAGLGASVVLLGRNEEKAARARHEIARATGNSDLDVVLADLADTAQVRRAADEIMTRHDRLDTLVHNAGVLVQERRTSPQGTELTVAVHVVAPFLLTSLLLPRLLDSAPSRILTVTSGGMYAEKLDVDRLEMSATGFNGVTAYARAKRAQVALTRAWGRLLADSPVVAHAVHPGWADTGGVAEALPRFYALIGPILRTAEEGADTIVWLGAAPEPGTSTGELWHDRHRRHAHRVPWTRRPDEAAETARLWDWCVERAGLADDERPETVLRTHATCVLGSLNAIYPV